MRVHPDTVAEEAEREVSAIVTLETPAPAYALVHKSVPAAVSAARSLVRAALHDWGMDPLAGDAELVVGELVANAIRVADDIRITLSREAGRVLVEVQDGSTDPPVLRTAGPYDESGRGLRIVDAYAANWGHRLLDDGTGKVVWAKVGDG